MIRLFKYIWCISLIITFFTTGLIAQEWTVSQDFSMVKNTYFKVMGKWGEDYKMTRVGLDFVELISFEEDLSIRWGRMIEIVKDEPIIHEVFEGDNRFYILYSIIQEDSTKLILSRYDENGTISSAMIVKTIASELGRPQYEPMLSLNNEWLSLSYMGVEGLLEVLIISLDNMLKVREDVYDLSSFELDGNYPYQHVTNNGQVFIFVETFELVENRPKQFMTILQVFLDERPTAIKEIDFGNSIVETPFFLYNIEEEELHILGIYRDYRVPAGMGVYHKIIFKDFEQLAKSSSFPIESSILAEYHTKSRNPLPGIPGLRLIEAHIEKDKSITVFTEVRFDSPRDSGVRGLSGMVDMDHYYDEIFVMNINSDGSPGWQKLMKKEQYSVNDSALKSSYFILQRDDAYRLIFNEEIRRNSKVLDYKLELNGNTSKNTIYDEKRHSLNLYISKAANINQNEILIPSIKNRTANLVRLRYPDETNPLN